MARTQRAAPLLQALQEDRRKALELFLEGLDSEGFRLLAAHLPPNLEDLKIRLTGSSIKDQDIVVFGENLPAQLKTLNLDLTNCASVTDAGIADLEKFIDPKKVIMDLTM